MFRVAVKDSFGRFHTENISTIEKNFRRILRCSERKENAREVGTPTSAS
jgi:hypothetical protein